MITQYFCAILYIVIFLLGTIPAWAMDPPEDNFDSFSMQPLVEEGEDSFDTSPQIQKQSSADELPILSEKKKKMSDKERFEMRLQSSAIDERKSILKAAGFNPDKESDHDDMWAALTLTPKKLKERLENNEHGHILRLIGSLLREDAFVLDSLVHVKSLKVLILQDINISSEAFISLINALARNEGIKYLTLKEMNFKDFYLSILADGLLCNGSIREITILPKQYDTYITPESVRNFYDILGKQKYLRYVNWGKEKKVVQVVKNLAQGDNTHRNTLAAVHIGFKYKSEAVNHFREVERLNGVLKRVTGKIDSLAAQILEAKAKEKKQNRKGLKKDKSLKEKKKKGLKKDLVAVESLKQTTYQESQDFLVYADQQGNPLASYILGNLEEVFGSYNAALEWYKRSADLHYGEAFVKLAEYERGNWPPKNPLKINIGAEDYHKSFNYFLCATGDGQPFVGYQSAKAFYRIARFYERGGAPKPVETNLDKAHENFYQAVMRGYPDAFTGLAALYRNPDFAQRNEAHAVYYLDEAKRYEKSKRLASLLSKQ